MTFKMYNLPLLAFALDCKVLLSDFMLNKGPFADEMSLCR